MNRFWKLCWYRQLLYYWHNVDMFNCCILTEAWSCRLELAYFAEKIFKNRLACKNAVAFAYYGSCRFLVSGSCLCSFLKNRRILLFLWISKINVAFVKTFQESYLVDDLTRTWFKKALPVWAVSGVSVCLCKRITMQTTTWLKARFQALTDN